MKPVGRHRLVVVFIFILIHAVTASATTFTTDTYIGPNDPSYDGQDIIVTNCTLTVDGVHGFNSLQILNTAVLTHSAFTNGPQQITNIVSDENQTLSTTNPATLNNANVNTNTIVVMDSTATITYTPDVDYLITVTNQFTELTLTSTSSIPQGATVLVSYDWVQDYLGLSLTISNDMDVAIGGSVDLSGMGYAGGNGFSNGVGTSLSTVMPATIIGGGGGHGGCGGTSVTLFAPGGASYDSTTNPANLGSGGGFGLFNGTTGGAGGGLGRFYVGGTAQVDGQILADGIAGNGNVGGGAGGGLLLSAQTFAGAGSISAQGGGTNNTAAGGGGGGIIAIYSATNIFTGTIVAFGGVGPTFHGNAGYGGAGTILIRSFTNGPGQLLIANNGTPGTNTTFFAPAISNLTISGGAIAQPLNSTFTISNLFVGSDSTLLPTSSGSLTLAVNGYATVESNAFIDADSQSASGYGAGSSSCGAGAGGGNDGEGGASICGSPSGSTFGYYGGSTSLGSPGGGSPAAFGGGAINLTVVGTLSLGGQISANGASGIATNGGGGSGGSVWLTAGTISGSGTIAANGGAANNPFGGGGGGGAVAVIVGTNLFTGAVTAYGAAGANAGGAGTVYLKTNGSGTPQVIVDNDGLTGGITPLNTTFFGPDLTVRGGAILTDFQPFGSVGNLLVGSNSFISGAGNPNTGITLTTTNAVVQSGGGFTLDAQSISGIHQGMTLNSTGGGGGNGGDGGMSASNALPGVSSPVSFDAVSIGSFGGSGQGGLGGHGGGELNFTVPGTLQLDGAISANGGTSTNLNSGGGSGGGIELSVGTLTGAGTISANGGAANNFGGGGGGGKIAILYLTNSFAGNITAYGGAGANDGGAGTIYQAQTETIGGSPISQQMLVDNGGVPGAETVFYNGGSSSPGVFDLIVRGAASVSDGILALTNGNLTVGSNSVLLAAASQQLVVVLTNATIQASGAIRADGIISLPSSGQGSSLNSTGGGGGNAGMGGPSALGAAGGAVVLNSYSSPSSSGAEGGGGPSFSGNGGGSLRFIVNGTLQLDGTVSSQGTTGSITNSGGGSGGSIWLSAGTISGAGTISVNGGAGNGSKGGGGGGGGIALNYNTNLFTGSLTAYGGAGANYGGAGTIYTSSSFSGAGAFTSMVVDNGGTVGQLTLLNPGTFSAISLSSCTIKGGGIMRLTNAGVEGSGANATFGNLLVGSNSTFLPYYPFIAVQTNADVQPGGTIIVTAFGNAIGAPTDGGGIGIFETGGGGGHGGYGGYGLYQANPLASGGSVTDSIVAPVLYGGDGGPTREGGAGGDPIHLFVGGTLQLDGIVSANGGSSTLQTNGGGGGGGAIWLQVNELLGAGSISANGGAGANFGGGGGGGRIAIWANTNLFAGAITARGGAGRQYGGPGTIYFNSNTNGRGLSSQLVIDSGGSSGANAGISTAVNGVDVLVTNGAGLGIGVAGNMTWNSLTILSNCSLELVSNFTALNLTINSNVVIQPTGSIDLDGQGFAANGGPDAGKSGLYRLGSGGGHGGIGGPSTSEPGGGSYDSITMPVMAGSGGGFYFTTNSAGGGALQLSVKGTLDIEGTISANGLNGVAVLASGSGGGGAGGSLWLTAGTFSGAGSISANGGSGIVTNGTGSGGGGGGRIAVYFNSNAFTGTFSAHGGTGFALSGGAGTIFLETNSIGIGQLIVDNGGSPGLNTPLDSLAQPVALSLRNDGDATSGTPLTLQSLCVGSNAYFSALLQTSIVLTVLSDAIIDTNGTIFANGDGYKPGAGPGNGSIDSSGDGSGGGYGGTGGASLFGAVGGSTYGSSNQPVDFGSAGGDTNSLTTLSQGGGAIRLLVDGNLTVNGSVSANGDEDPLATGAGGGSGGSIWITAQSLAGNGSLTANGGMGNGGQGGGGGGGRIAIYASANSFSGTASASGGSGAFPGQPGTIVIATNLLVSGSVTDTNGVGITGVTLQPSGLAAVTTDSSGSYSVAAPLFWTGTVAPTSAGFFVPNLRNYSSLSTNASNQNYLLALSADFNISSTSFDGTNLNFSWYGINGVTYQPLYSSNLLNWLPYGPAFIGSNAPATFALPVSTAPQLFFRLGVSY